MKPGIEAVYIASHNFLHYEQARQSLLQDKLVLLEKHMTLHNEHAVELVRLAAEKEMSLEVSFHLRFRTAVELVRKMIHHGRLMCARRPEYLSAEDAGGLHFPSERLMTVEA